MATLLGNVFLHCNRRISSLSLKYVLTYFWTTWKHMHQVIDPIKTIRHYRKKFQEKHNYENKKQSSSYKFYCLITLLQSYYFLLIENDMILNNIRLWIWNNISYNMKFVTTNVFFHLTKSWHFDIEKNWAKCQNYYICWYQS